MKREEVRVAGFPARGGLALILVVGVLGILAVLAAAFVTMAQLERRASLQRLYVTKARLLARSGLEDAVARLSAGQDAALASARYGGEDFDGSGTFSMEERTYEVYGPNVLDVETCPAKQAMRPSFFRKDTFGTLPDLVRVEGRLRGYTGQLKGDAVSGGNVYVLKVEDESGKINVNGGFLDAQDRDDGGSVPDHRDPDVHMTPTDPKDTGLGWNAQLVRILNILGASPEVGVANLGTLAIQNRPVGGYRSVKALEQAVGATKDLSPYLTVSSWVDAKVVHPNGYASQASASALADVKKARVPLRLEEGGRPPVNLNAAPLPVLVALIQDLEGHSWQDPNSGNAEAYLIQPAMAPAIAGALIAARPFATWQRFSEAVDALVPTVIGGMNLSVSGGGNLCGADLLKANFNPNTQLSKELPDQLLWKWIDKSDLVAWSTEGSLGPTGTFGISAVGRVLDGRGRLLAEASAGGRVEAFSPVRQTTQQDFVDGRPLEEYLSSSSGGPYGNRTTGAEASWRPASWAAGRGLAVATYPCAPAALPAGKAANFDGFIGLATVETAPQDPLKGTLMFLQHFDDGWDAEGVPGNPGGDPGRQEPGPGTPASDSCLQGSVSGYGTWPDPPAEPSTLTPDGAHAQNLRAPAYRAPGNFPLSSVSGDPAPSSHGVVSYWVKPSVCRSLYRIDMICVCSAGLKTQAMALGRKSIAEDLAGAKDERWGILFENKVVGSDTGYERQFHVSVSPPDHPDEYLLPGMRWHLVTAFFDTDTTTRGWDVHFAVRGAKGSGTDDEVYNYPTSYDTGLGEDLFRSGMTFALGGQGGVAAFDLLDANQVIDEFAICDFTDLETDALPESDGWADGRYADGRYYKGGDGRFLSGPLQPRPGAPVRLLRAQWTEYLPREARAEIFQDGTTVPPAGQPRLIDPILADGPSGQPRAWLELELLEGGGTLTGPALQPLSQGGRIQRILSAFRYRLCFRTNPVNPLTGRPDPDNQPLLETPFLDDVTFFWQSMTGPRVLSWDAP